MRQIFYVGVDEEISSLVDKLRRSHSVENYFVVGNRSLISQSAVNFKLLKKEADKIQKGIVVASQDEQVIKMSQRAGIDTVDSIEGQENEESFVEPDYGSNFVNESENEKGKRLSSVGSDSFYGGLKFSADQENVEEKNASFHEDPRKASQDSDGFHINRPIAVRAHKRNLSDLKSKKSVRLAGHHSHRTESRRHADFVAESKQSKVDLKKSFEDFLDPEKEKKFEKVFSQAPSGLYEAPKQEKKSDSKGFSMSPSFLFSVLAVVLAAMVAGYFYIPSAVVNVYLQDQDKKISLNLEADISITSVDAQKPAIPARIVERKDEIMLSYEATGTANLSRQKARGFLVIYNEYGPSPQALVSNTRFEAAEGKIFRLTKGVTVPGATISGGETKPGAVEVEVVADQAGSEYNIGPSSFTIPGFKGGDKYQKIYAKSTESMKGGSTSGDEIKSVSQSDLDSAKEKVQNSLKEKMENIVSTEMQSGEIMIVPASKIEVAESLALASPGDVRDKFDYQAKGNGKFLIVKRTDVENLIKNKYLNSAKKDFQVEIEKIDVLFENVEVDFGTGKAKVNAVAKVSARPVFDREEFKKEILAKDEDGVKTVMEKYPYIANIEIGVNPGFMSNLPRISSRIRIETLENEGNE